MKLPRLLHVALFGAVLFTSATAQTEADIASLLAKAQRGNSIAQYRLGLAYTNGHGVPTDPIEAYIWLSLAYEGGFRGKALGNIAGGLDPAQLETARVRLIERRASLNKPAAPAPATAPTKPAPAENEIPIVRTVQTSAPTPVLAPVTPAALQQELDAAIADKKQLSTELSQSWNETETLKKQLAESQAGNDLLSSEAEKIRTENNTLFDKSSRLEAEINGLRAEHDQGRALSEQGKSAIAQAAELQSALDAATQAAAREKQSLGEELARSSEQISALKTQLAARPKATAPAPAAPAYPDLRNQVAALETALAAAKTAAPAHPDLSGRVKELETTLASLTGETAAAKQEAAHLADERLDREKQFVLLQQQTAQLNSAHTALQQEAAALRNAAAPTQYPDLSGKVAELEAALHAAQSAAPAYPDLSGKVSELEAALASLNAESAAARQDAARAADSRLENEKQIALLQHHAGELTKAHATLQQENESLRQAAAAPRYPDLSGKVAELEAALASAQAAPAPITPAAPAYPDLREQVSSLEAQIVAFKADSTQAERQIAALTRFKETAEKSAATPAAPAYPDLREQVANLQAALNSANAAAPAYPDLREQVATLEARITGFKSDSAQAAQQIAALTQAKEAAEKSFAASPAAPAYPDLREQVANLQAALNSANTAPAHPDLSAKVQELEAALAARASESGLAGKDVEELRKTNTETEQKLAAAEQARTELAQQYDEFKRSALANQRQHQTLQSQVQILESEKAALRQQGDADQTRLAEFSSQLAAARRQLAEHYPTTPAYPDLRARVEQLEGELTKTNEQSAGMINLVNRAQEESKAAGEQLEQLRTANRTLETKLATAKTPKAKTPAYPDLREQVATLEGQIATLRSDSAQAGQQIAAPTQAKEAAEKSVAANAATPAAPAYPDLREQVSNLEIQLEAARALPAHLMPRAEYDKMKRELADMQEKLGTTLRGYAVLEKERDALANRPAPTTSPEQSKRISELEAQLANSQASLQQVLNSRTPAAQPVAQKKPEPAPAPVTVAASAPTRPAAPVSAEPTRPAPTVAAAPTRPAAPAVFAPAAAEVRKHLVVAGDALAKLSQRYYGTPNRWQEIYNANRELIAPNGALRVGTELRIP